MKFMFNKNNKLGIAALPTILILGSIIIDIAIVTAIGIIFLTRSGYGIRLSDEALAAAKAGVQDGILRLARDKNFSSTYQLDVGKRSAEVVICKDLPECGGVGKHKVSATGTAFTKKRKIEAVVIIDSTNGVIRLESLKEIAL